MAPSNWMRSRLDISPVELIQARNSTKDQKPSLTTPLWGLPLAGRVGYSGHGSLLVRDAAPGRYLPSQQGGLPSENPKKRQKSSSASFPGAICLRIANTIGDERVSGIVFSREPSQELVDDGILLPSPDGRRVAAERPPGVPVEEAWIYP